MNTLSISAQSGVRVHTAHHQVISLKKIALAGHLRTCWGAAWVC